MAKKTKEKAKAKAKIDQQEFGEDSIKKLREDLTKVLDKFGEKNNMTLKIGNIRFSMDNCRFPVEVTREGGKDVQATRYEEQMVWELEQFGKKLKPLGSTLTVEGEKIKIVGFNGKATPRPVIGERVSDGQRFKLPISAVAV